MEESGRQKAMWLLRAAADILEEEGEELILPGWDEERLQLDDTTTIVEQTRNPIEDVQWMNLNAVDVRSLSGSTEADVDYRTFNSSYTCSTRNVNLVLLPLE